MNYCYYYNIYDIGIITHNKVLKQCKYNGILIIQFEDRIEYYKMDFYILIMDDMLLKTITL